MKKLITVMGVLLLLLAGYLFLWPVPVEPVPWDAPVSPGYRGPHAVNTRLANLRMISLTPGMEDPGERERS